MTIWVVVPIKAPAACKTRLAGALDAAARTALVARMLDHVVTTAQGAVGVDRVLLLGPNRHTLGTAIPLIPDAGAGLNAALADARAAALTAKVDRLIILPADLPLLTGEDLGALVSLPEDTIGIAPDRHGRGTNALSLPLPDAADFRFLFGDASLTLHRAEAERLGCRIAEIARAGLATDIDEPSDLALL